MFFLENWELAECLKFINDAWDTMDIHFKKNVYNIKTYQENYALKQ